MNNNRRKQIDSAASDLEKINTEVAGFAEETEGSDDPEGLADREENWSSRVDDVRTELESIKDDEQEYYDNMPEGLQGGDKGSDAEQAIQNLEGVISWLEELVGVEEVGEFIANWREGYEENSSKLQDAAV